MAIIQALFRIGLSIASNRLGVETGQCAQLTSLHSHSTALAAEKQDDRWTKVDVVTADSI